MHKNEHEVKEARNLKDGTRGKKLQKLKRRGIAKFNIELIKDPLSINSNIIRERNQGDHQLRMCDQCKGFFAKDYMWSHLKHCQQTADFVPTTTPVERLEAEHSGLNVEFRKEIIEHLKVDEIGKVCKSDPSILS